MHNLLLETTGSMRAPNVFDYGNTSTHPQANPTGNTQLSAAVVIRPNNFKPHSDKMQPMPETKT